MNLLMFCPLGRLLNVPTPTCDVIVKMGEILLDKNYSAKTLRTVEALALAGLDLQELKNYLETGELHLPRV